ncbi:hypothetical protein [Massilia glaciei]|uniref:hypothetical protein n=1 Tax=Massilia glaciei TaxID=1524097 RepID=UPI0011B25111|nr:hypothetical protein [Massilia glaciei]
MYKLFYLLGAVLVLSGCEQKISTKSQTSVKTTTENQNVEVGSATAKFECTKSSLGSCDFVLFSSTCVNGTGVNGKRSITCTDQVLEEFSLKEGESKTVSQLPSSFKSCATSGTAPICAK